MVRCYKQVLAASHCRCVLCVQRLGLSHINNQGHMLKENRYLAECLGERPLSGLSFFCDFLQYYYYLGLNYNLLFKLYSKRPTPGNESTTTIYQENLSGPFCCPSISCKGMTLTSFTSMLVAPASKEFSMSSFTTLTTDVIIWELDRRRTVAAGNCFILAFSRVAGTESQGTKRNC